MTASRFLSMLALCALFAATGTNAMAVTGAHAPFLQSGAPALVTEGFQDGAERYAQADCSAAAAQAAAQTGGEVLSVQASSEGGRTVCVVTVLIPGQGGERPRRTTITIPG